jgi:hypothetical protein
VHTKHCEVAFDLTENRAQGVAMTPTRLDRSRDEESDDRAKKRGAGAAPKDFSARHAT